MPDSVPYGAPAPTRDSSLGAAGMTADNAAADVVEPPGAAGFDEVVLHDDPDSGLRAVVAIHSTALGPALGGTRFHAYPDLAAAQVDALDLARAMAYKNAVAGLPHGGGKAVILGDPARDKSVPLLHAYGRLVDSLQGRYITAADVGTTVADLDVVAETCPYVTGRSPERGGAGDSGQLTALGVYQGMCATAQHLWGRPTLEGRRVGIVGVGKVGRRLAHLLLRDGAALAVADVEVSATDRLLAEAPAHARIDVLPDEAAVLAGDVDVYAPCALGHALTAERADRLQAVAVCGGANNQLDNPDVGAQLAERGVLYAPDYVVNAGGVIAVAQEWAGQLDGRGYDDALARRRTMEIFETTLAVLSAAAADGIRPEQAADRLAEERMEAAR